MVHLFSLNDESFVFDSESGALYRIDEIATEILQGYIDNEGRRPADSWLSEIDEDALEIADQFDTLIEAKALFAPAHEITAEQLYPDGVFFKAMCLHLCHDCNLRCTYCFAGTGDYGCGTRSMLSYETGCKAIDFLIEASGKRRNLDIDFFGGEPLLNWKVLCRLVEYCETQGPLRGKNIRLTLTTNCTLLNEQKIDYINEHFKNVVLSIDGRKEVHDRMRPDARGKGSYDKVVEKILKFIEKRGDREYYLRGTYTHENLDFANDVLHLADIADQVSIEPVVAPQGVGYDLHDEDLPILKEQYEILASKMDNLRQAGDGFNFFHFMIDLAKGPCIFKRVKGCGVGTEYCAVTPEGDIYPCHQLVGDKSLIMGNVNDDPIVINRNVQRPFDRLLIPQNKACKSCWAKYFCGGGCPANHFHKAKTTDYVDPFYCELLQKRLECSLWLYARKRDRENAEMAAAKAAKV